MAIHRTAVPHCCGAILSNAIFSASQPPGGGTIIHDLNVPITNAIVSQVTMVWVFGALWSRRNLLNLSVCSLRLSSLRPDLNT